MGWNSADDSGLSSLSMELIWLDFVNRLHIIEMMRWVLSHAIN